MRDWFTLGVVMSPINVILGLLLGLCLLGNPSDKRVAVVIAITLLVASLSWVQAVRDQSDKRQDGKTAATMIGALQETNALLRARLPEPEPATVVTGGQVQLGGTAIPEVFTPGVPLREQAANLLRNLDAWIEEKSRSLPALAESTPNDTIEEYLKLSRAAVADYGPYFMPRIRYIAREAHDAQDRDTEELARLNDNPRSFAGIQLVAERLRLLVGALR